ncbi:MAG: MIP/aquaporin family protein [Planctomycetota bacterium]
MSESKLPAAKPSLVQQLLAECFGTFCLTFAGTGAIIINETSHGAITHAGIAITFGLIVMAMIYSIGDISGCHINPAVTIGLTLMKKVQIRHAALFVFGQCLGAILASSVLRALFPDNITLGATQPSGAAAQSLTLEFLLTLILMFVILNVTSVSEPARSLAGLVIGSVVALEAMFAGPICGASMNPARSIAPALVSGHVNSMWIYIVGPITGAIAGGILFRLIRPRQTP